MSVFDLRIETPHLILRPPIAADFEPWAELAADEDDTDPEHSLAASSSGLVLAGGLVLLAPLVSLAPAHRGALALLLIGLATLALIAVLVRAARVSPA